MPTYLCAFDNETDTVPPRSDWTVVTADSYRNACLEFCKTIEHTGTYEVIVASEAHYQKRGWEGMAVHSFKVTFTPPDIAPRDRFTPFAEPGAVN